MFTLKRAAEGTRSLFVRIDMSEIFWNRFHLHPIPTGDLQTLTNFQYDQLLVLLDFTSRKCTNASKCFNGTCHRAVCELSVAPAYSYRFWPQTKRSFAPQLGLTNGPNNSPLPRTKSPSFCGNHQCRSYCQTSNFLQN